MEIKREFEFTQQECDVLIGVLTRAADRCRRNATSTRQGYGTVTSKMKHKEWMDRAEEYHILIATLSHPWT